jgi:hypothetical protein
MLLLICCATADKKARLALSLDIRELHPTAKTHKVKQDILELATKYDLESFIYTKLIFVDSKAKTRSHPTLVLDTRFAEDKEKLLSQLIHEELHWWLELNHKKLEVAMPDMKRAFPQAPPIKGARDPNSTYKHLIICWMEYMAITKYMGEDTAKSNLKFFAQKENRYPWIYPQVLEHSRKIELIVRKHDLIPAEMYPKGLLLL